ncbi:MAG TPA: ATP synthase F1 subunit epsilon [Flavobacteriales bacterium]|nr:ATP synthase F1 subunit epsilon [Flavobacteriales bacterium]HCA83454.1 ATP synthase F1 subunit epsilon [Flavobacteriales bacterium]HRE73502.1 ATP synthase F1 subunit epsilon [Flavobacteriales bacterium]HRE95477.1 ATP synthase F1 subunit epsilon [Flavobacteriales bacterium]HRJ34939.1 ATP synthase F1 subunit epsilon [Flavobacteriales bacterium]
MKVDILSPDSNLYSGEASAVSLPGKDGSLGILENHAPLITTLKKGVVKLSTNEGEKTFDVGGGVVEVNHNKVIILAE